MVRVVGIDTNINADNTLKPKVPGSTDWREIAKLAREIDDIVDHILK